MERDGLVIRKVLSVMPPSVEYSLSEFGKSALPVLKSINNWSKSKDDQIIKIVKKNIKKIDSHITI
jgi:DNA-binding HxlR family transcriptional regulator